MRIASDLFCLIFEFTSQTSIWLLAEKKSCQKTLTGSFYCDTIISNRLLYKYLLAVDNIDTLNQTANLHTTEGINSL